MHTNVHWHTLTHTNTHYTLHFAMQYNANSHRHYTLHFAHYSIVCSVKSIHHTLYTLQTVNLPLHNAHCSGFSAPIVCTPCKLHINQDTQCSGCALHSLHRNVIVHSAQCSQLFTVHDATCICSKTARVFSGQGSSILTGQCTWLDDTTIQQGNHHSCVCSAQFSCTFIVRVLYLVQVLSRAIHSGYHLPCRVNTAVCKVFYIQTSIYREALNWSWSQTSFQIVALNVDSGLVCLVGVFQEFQLIFFFGSYSR